MFCPFCGVKQDAGSLRCTSCKKIIPKADAASAATPVAAKQRPKHADGAGVLKPEMLGSVGDRMLALFFDRVALAAVLLMAAAPFADRLTEIQQRLPSPAVSILLGAISLYAIVFLYHFAFEASVGTTLGKAVMGLQVQNAGEGGRVGAIATRNALRIVDSLALYLVAFLSASFTTHKQRVGDVVAGTVVLNLSVAKGARGAMMGLWVALIAVSLVIASWLCPECVGWVR